MAIWNKILKAFLPDNKTLFEAVVIADKDGNPLTSFGTTSTINIAAGDVDGWSNIHKFGAVPELSINSTGTIWDRNNTIYPWAAIDNSGLGHTLTVSSVAANNEGSLTTTEDGTQVTVMGLDVNFNEISEVIDIVGSTGTGTTVFRRIYRVFCTDGATNTSRVLIKAGAVVVACVNENWGQSLMSVYTIPAGKTGYLLKGSSSCQASADGTVNMYVRTQASVAFRIGHSLEVSGAGGQYIYEFPVPTMMPAGTDIDVRATSRSNKGRFTATFDIIMVDD